MGLNRCRWDFSALYISTLFFFARKTCTVETVPWKVQSFRCFACENCTVVVAAKDGLIPPNMSTVLLFRLRKLYGGSSC